MSADLSGRVAVVTGALGRLGPVWIDALTGAGMRVVGIDVRQGDSAAEQLEVASVTDRDALEGVRERIGVPWVLVNNAGIDQPPSDAAAGDGIGSVSADEFLHVLDVNTRGTFVVSQVFG